MKEAALSISLVQNTLTNTPLKDGDTVFVRVVEDNGNGTYTASFAGNRFLVRSHNPLTNGTSFKAQIHVENSMVKIIPLFENSAETGSSQTTSSFLQRIGLPQDTLSLRLVQFFQQHMMKINLPLAQKARAASSAFPGREKDAAEAALFLTDKGIDCTEEMIALVLRNARSCSTTYDEDSAVLSYINHKKTSSRHWLLLPFTDEKSQSLSGVVKILINTELHKTEKFIIECNTAVKKFIFVLQYGNSKDKKTVLTFCTDPESNDKAIHNLSDTLYNLLGSSFIQDIAYSQSLAYDGLFSANLDPSYIQGSV